MFFCIKTVRQHKFITPTIKVVLLLLLTLAAWNSAILFHENKLYASLFDTSIRTNEAVGEGAFMFVIYGESFSLVG